MWEDKYKLLSLIIILLIVIMFLIPYLLMIESFLA